MPVTASPSIGRVFTHFDRLDATDPDVADQQGAPEQHNTAGDSSASTSAAPPKDPLRDWVVPARIALQLVKPQNQTASANGKASARQMKAAVAARGGAPDQQVDAFGQAGNSPRYPGTPYADASGIMGESAVASDAGGAGNLAPVCPKPATTAQSSNYAEMRSLSATEGFFAFNPVGRFAKGAAGAAYDAWTALPRTLVGAGNLARDAVGYADHAIFPQRSVITGQAFPYQPKSGLIQSIQQKGVAGTLGDGITGVVRNAPAIGLVGALYAPNRDWANVGAQTFNTGVVGTGVVAGIRRSIGTEVSPGPVNFMSSSDKFFTNASKRSDIDPNGMFDVIAHGSSTNIEIMTNKGAITVDQRAASRLIQGSPGYQFGQPIRLLSCSTGSCNAGFAQNLANKMGVPVQAPTDLVWAYGDGNMVVAPRASLNPKSPYFNVPDFSKQGTFENFIPGGNKP